MSAFNVPVAQAATQYEEIPDTCGRSFLVSSVAVQVWRSQGLKEIDVKLVLAPPRPETPWLTVTEAASVVIDEEIVQGWTVADAAKRISEVCGRNRLRHDGVGTNCRIDPDSLRQWMLLRRKRDALKDGD